MNTETVNKLKVAVAQFNEAFEIIDDCLPQAIAESNNRAHHLEGAIGCISDKATLARLKYELDVVNEDQSSLECARDDWFRIAEEYRHRFHVISDRIDESRKTLSRSKISQPMKLGSGRSSFSSAVTTSAQ